MCTFDVFGKLKKNKKFFLSREFFFHLKTKPPQISAKKMDGEGLRKRMRSLSYEFDLTTIRRLDSSIPNGSKFFFRYKKKETWCDDVKDYTMVRGYDRDFSKLIANERKCPMLSCVAGNGSMAHMLLHLMSFVTILDSIMCCLAAMFVLLDQNNVTQACYAAIAYVKWNCQFNSVVTDAINQRYRYRMIMFELAVYHELQLPFAQVPFYAAGTFRQLTVFPLVDSGGLMSERNSLYLWKKPWFERTCLQNKVYIQRAILTVDFWIIYKLLRCGDFDTAIAWGLTTKNALKMLRYLVGEPSCRVCKRSPVYEISKTYFLTRESPFQIKRARKDGIVWQHRCVFRSGNFVCYVPYGQAHSQPLHATTRSGSDRALNAVERCNFLGSISTVIPNTNRFK